MEREIIRETPGEGSLFQRVTAGIMGLFKGSETENLWQQVAEDVACLQVYRVLIAGDAFTTVKQESALPLDFDRIAVPRQGR
ncbi:MAG: hypothetical protein ACYDEQ_05710 [Desulfocucumaceae bacterium]